jgi:hypothetical protein
MAVFYLNILELKKGKRDCNLANKGRHHFFNKEPWHLIFDSMNKTTFMCIMGGVPTRDLEQN